MKTKFILHGGFNSTQTGEDNSEFYKEILKDAPEDARVLLVPFAKDADRVLVAIDRVTSQFNKNKLKNISVEAASEEGFIEQLKNADVVYFHGGVSMRLLEILKNYPDLKGFLKGKIIAGESAGANVLGEFFYSPSFDIVSEGLGVLPLKIIPHYKEEYSEKLEDVGNDIESCFLPEYTYQVFIENID